MVSDIVVFVILLPDIAFGVAAIVNVRLVPLYFIALKLIKYLVFIELDNWHYWKDKEQRLIKLIKNLNR